MGMDADSSWAQRATSLSSTPPAARKASVREVMEFVQVKGEAGYPPRSATDAQLGYSVTAYQSAEILFGPCEGEELILARIEGSRTRDHSGPKSGLAQRAKERNWPCCARATQIAAPSRRKAGEFSKVKAHRLQSWREHEPSAARQFAARLYAQTIGYPPQHWD